MDGVDEQRSTWCNVNIFIFLHSEKLWQNRDQRHAVHFTKISVKVTMRVELLVVGRWLSVVLGCFLALSTHVMAKEAVIVKGPITCSTGTKCRFPNQPGQSCMDPSDSSIVKESELCISLENSDVSRALHWLAVPPKAKCAKLTTVQGIDVCEDQLPKNCLIWSMLSSLWCDDWGTLEFEKFWSKRCDVVLFHLTPSFKGNTCKQPEGRSFTDFPRLSVNRTDMWGGRTFNAFYKQFPR